MRRYFSELLGNDDVKRRIGAAIDGDSVPHAFLIEGPEGSGKSTLAGLIAEALNCERRVGGRASEPTFDFGAVGLSSSDGALPCGVCNRCRRIREGNFTDIKYLTRRDGRATVGVDEVRDFREDMFLSATESDYKIYVIDDAESMTVEAQNALLTILEEPPAGVIIIMLATECDRILTTIKSRVQHIAMTRFSADELRRELVARSPEAALLQRESPESFDGIIMSAEGILGRAIALSDAKRAAENAEDRQETEALIAAIAPKSTYSALYRAIAALPTKRSELTASLERLTAALRDLITVKEAPGAVTLFYKSAETAAKISSELGIRRLLSVYDAVNEAHMLNSRNGNISNIIANLTGKIRAVKN